MNTILTYLLQYSDFVSGEQIASHFNISRTAVWKHIKQAEERGFDIESKPKKGYRINSLPKDIIIPEILSKYYGAPFPYEIVYLDCIDSTNTYAKKLALSQKKGNALVVTEDQECGRGRLSRPWQSQRSKDLTFTLILHTSRNLSEFYQYTIMSAWTVFEALSRILGPDLSRDLKIKWPNDIYFENKKICGILSEMITEEMNIKTMIIGIGINVNSGANIEKAISLRMLLKRDIDRNILLTELARSFHENHAMLLNDNFDTIFQNWKKHVGWLGNSIRFDTGKKIIEGTLLDIFQDGSLKILEGDTVNQYYSGDLLI